MFSLVLASADVCLITLNRESTYISGQGKMYSIMAAARPILAVMEPEALGAGMIVEERLGAVVSPGCPEGVAETLRRWRDQPDFLQECGVRARQVLLDRYSVEVCTRQFEELFTHVLNGKGTHP